MHFFNLCPENALFGFSNAAREQPLRGPGRSWHRGEPGAAQCLIFDTMVRLDLKSTEMTERRLVAAELAKFFGALSNPLRVQIIEELGDRELTVNELQTALGVPHALVSQHLGVLRANRVVAERRQGKHVFYHLKHPELALIVRSFLKFVSPDTVESERFLDAIQLASDKWIKAGKPDPLPVVLPKASRKKGKSS